MIRTFFYKDLSIKIDEGKLTFESNILDTTFNLYLAFLPDFITEFTNLLVTYEKQLQRKTKKEWIVTKSEPYTIKINSLTVVLRNDMDNEEIDFPYLLLPCFFEKLKTGIIIALNPSESQYSVLKSLENSDNPKTALQKIESYNGFHDLFKENQKDTPFSLETYYFFALNKKILETWIKLTQL